MDNHSQNKIAVTETLIKDACLTELKQKPYTHITISDICRIANISRSTFYRRYESVPTVIDAIFSDILKSISNMHEYLIQPEAYCKAPLCRFIRENEKYGIILVDPVLSDAFITYAAENRIDSVADDRTDLSELQKRSLKEFLLSGCVYVIRKNLRSNDHKWEQIKCAVDEFVRNGCG